MADTALPQVKGMVTDLGGTFTAKTIVPALKELREVISGGGVSGGGGEWNIVAADSTVLGFVPDAEVETPASLATDDAYMSDSLRLCWTNGQVIEIAPISLYVDASGMSTDTYLYAEGRHTIAYGELGADSDWTIVSRS